MQLTGPPQLNGWTAPMPSYRTPMSGVWEQDTELSTWRTARTGEKQRVGEAHWRGRWTVRWENITYETAMRILFEVGAQSALQSGTFLWTPRTRKPGDPQAIDTDNDGVADIVLEEVELKCRLVGGQDSTTPIFRSTADGTKVARLELEIESVNTFPERAGFGFPESLNFGVQAESGWELDMAFLDADGNDSSRIAQVVIADSGGQTVDVIDYPAGLPYSFPSTQDYSVSVVSGSNFDEIAEVRIDGPFDAGDPETEKVSDGQVFLFGATAFSGTSIRPYGTIDAHTYPDQQVDQIVIPSTVDYPWSEIPEARIFRGRKCSRTGTHKSYIEGNSHTEEFWADRGTAAQSVCPVPSQITTWVVHDQSHTLTDLSEYNPSTGPDLFFAVVGDSFSSPSASSTDITQLYSAPPSTIAGSGYTGTIGQLPAGVVTLRLGQVETLDGSITDMSQASADLQTANLTNFPHDEPTNKTGAGCLFSSPPASNDDNAGVDAFWAERSNLRSDLNLIWGTGQDTLLTQDSVDKLLGLGIGTSTEEDGIWDYVAAVGYTNLTQISSLQGGSADASADEITVDVESQLTDTEFRDVVFADGNEFRLVGTGTIDGVYESEGAVLNGDGTFTVTINPNATAIAQDDSGLAGTFLGQYAT